MSDVSPSGSSATPSAATPSSGGASSTPSVAPQAAKSTASPQGNRAAQSNNNPSAKPSIGDQVAKPAQQSAESKAAEVRARKAKVKVDGVEEDVDFDSVPLEDLVYDRQMSKAAAKRMQESADLKKKFQDIVSFGKDNVADAVKQLWGVDLDSWAEERIAKRFEEAQLPEHEKKQRDLEARIAKYEQAENERNEMEQKTTKQRYEEQVFRETEQTLVGALSKLDYPKEVASSILPVMIELADATLSRGMELDPDRLALETKRRLSVMAKKHITTMKGEALLSELGNDVVEEVIRARLAKHKVSPPVAPIPAPKDRPLQPKKERERPLSFKKRHLFGME